MAVRGIAAPAELNPECGMKTGAGRDALPIAGAGRSDRRASAQANHQRSAKRQPSSSAEPDMVPPLVRVSLVATR
jgi:hypothetical protein